MPFSRGLKTEIIYVCLSGAAALVFLYLVRPFSFANLPDRLLFGFGTVSIVAALVCVITAHLLYRRYFGDRTWSIGLEIAYSLLFLLCVASAIMIYGSYVNIMKLNATNFLLSLLYTTLIGIIPVSIRAIMLRNWRLKKDLAEMQAINDHLRTRKIITDEKIIKFPVSRNESLELINHDLLYVESSENYITIAWIKDLDIKKQMIRMTLKDAMKLINDPLIIFCHRSYIINLRKAGKIISQDGRTSILLKDSETQIPVSDTYKKLVRQKLNVIQ